MAAVIAAISAAPAAATSRSVAGPYYSTDIRTYLNGCAIDAINIGGQTLISAEDMEYYSFAVYWNADERQLSINLPCKAGDRTGDFCVDTGTGIVRSLAAAGKN